MIHAACIDARGRRRVPPLRVALFHEALSAIARHESGVSPEEQLFNDSIVRVPLDKQFRDKNGIFNSATSSPYLDDALPPGAVRPETHGSRRSQINASEDRGGKPSSQRA